MWSRKFSSFHRAPSAHVSMTSNFQLASQLVGWNDSFEIEEIEISNLDSTTLSKLTGYSFKNLLQ